MDSALREQIIAAIQKGEPLCSEWADLLFPQLRQQPEQNNITADMVEVINSVGQMLSAELDLQKLVQAVTDATTTLTGAEFGAFFYNVLTPAGESYTLYTLAGVPRENFSKFPMPRNTAVFTPTFHGEGIVRSDDITKDPRYGKNPPYYGKPKGHLAVTSYLAVPVISRSGEVWGGLFFGHSKAGVFTVREEQLIVGLAAQAAVAMDNARLYAEAQRQRQYLEVTLASIGDAVITTDTQGKVTFLNPVAETLTGWKTAHALGRDLREVFNIVHERTRQPILNPVEKVLREGTIVGLANHTVLISADASEVAISDSAAPIRDSAGNVTGAILVFRDVSEQKRTQEIQSQLAAIITGSDDAIIGMDLNGIVTSWNRGAKQMYGYTADEMIRHPITMLVPSGYPNDVPAILERIARGESIGHYETRRQCKDGPVLDVSLTISPIYDEEGVVIGASKIARNITERKAHERQLAELLAREKQARTEAERARAETEKALHSRDEFLSVASHELRTPITSLRGFTQLLAQQMDRNGIVSSERLRIALSHITAQSLKLTSLVDQLLDISRIEAGKLIVVPQRTNVVPLVQNVIVQEQITAHHHTIRLQAPPKVEADIDPLRIEQVLTNLIDNALRYTSGGTIDVEVGSANENFIQISVTDEGEGIPAEHRDKLFERFYQAHKISSGMGLGLYISRQIVELHGGTIHAEFPSSGGTRFVIYLPAT